MTAPAALSKKPSALRQRWPTLLSVVVIVAVFAILLSIASARAHHSTPNNPSNGISSGTAGSPFTVHDISGALVLIPGGKPLLRIKQWGPSVHVFDT